MKQIVMNVPDISCEHCEHAITEALTPVTGVQRVAVDIDRKLVDVTYDESSVNVEQLKDILQEEEYPVASVTGA